MFRAIRFLLIIFCTLFSVAAFAAKTCANGEYLSNDICVQCDAGYYCTNDVKTACPSGTYSKTGASTCTTISTGYFATDCDIPYGYTQLEYIESTGTQYIDTGVVYKIAPRVVTSIYLTTDGDKDILGTSATQNGNFIVDYAITRGQVYARYGSATATTYVPSIELSVWADVEYGPQWIENGVVKIEFPDYDFSTNTQSLRLFGARNNSSLRMGVAQIYDGDTLVRNMVPARRDIDGVVGMYDTVEHNFYENSGTGKFIAGTEVINAQRACKSQIICPAGSYCVNGNKISCPSGTYNPSAGASECVRVSDGYFAANCETPVQVPYGYTQLEYIESTGTQYIDTNVVYKSSPRVITSIYLMTSDDKDILGTPSASNGNFIVNYAFGRGFVYARYGSATAKTYVPSVELSTWADVEYGPQWIENGVVKAEFPDYDFSVNTQSLRLLGARNNSALRMKTVKIYDGDSLVRNMIPARRDNDGAIGMYDIVEHKFYENAGTGNFITGLPINNGCTSQTFCAIGDYCLGGTKYPCANAPEHSAYTNTGWATANCPWKCTDNRIKTAIGTCGKLCDAGITTLNTSSGIKVPIFADKNTSPSIYIERNNTVCYIDLIPGQSATDLQTEYKGTTYHTTRYPNPTE